MPARRRRALAAATTATLAAGLTLAGVAPAHAAALTVTDAVGLIAAVQNGNTDVITIGAPITLTTLLQTNGDDTIDLNGFTVTSTAVQLQGGTFVIGSSAAGGAWVATSTLATRAGFSTTGATLSVTSGTVTATGGNGAAGIGGGAAFGAGTLDVSGGTVTATGTAGAAGIGGGLGGNGGTTTITGGTVSATGDGGGAGIGGGRSTAGGAGALGGATTISGGTVTAISSKLIDPTAGGGAGIGGGFWAGPGAGTTGGTVTINGTAVVTATGTAGTAPDAGAGIGGGANGSGGSINIGGSASVTANAMSSTAYAVGRGSTGTSFGTLSVDGTSTLNLQGVTTIPPGVTVTGTGTIRGTVFVTNLGSIQTNVDHSGGFQVLSNNFAVTFDRSHPGAPAPVERRVYATTMLLGARALPSEPTRVGWSFNGWNTAPNGTGTPFTTHTTLTADITVYADWISNGGTGLTLSGPTSVRAGDSSVYTVRDFGTDVTGDITFSTNDLSAAVTGNQIEFRTAGTWSVLARSVSDPSQSITGTVTVTAGDPQTLALTPSATSIDQGGTLTVTATATDAYGNSLGDVSSSIVLSSSVPTDQIVGNTVTFPTASPHTITATLGAATASFVVQVNAAAAGGIATTGSDPTWSIALALILLAAGGALLLGRRLARA